MKACKLSIIITSICVFIAWCSADVLKIGAIFDKEDDNKEIAFLYAIEEINNNKILEYHELEGAVLYVPPNNPYKAMMAACELISEGVIAILGPSTEDNSNVVQSVCDDKDIPHLDVRWDDQPLNPIVNVYPFQDVLTLVYTDIITAWNYDNFVILYEDNESLKRVGELIKLCDNKNQKITVRQLDRNNTGNYRPALKEVWKSGATHFVLDCSIDILEEVLRQAQQIGLMTSKEHYIITNLDFHTIDTTPYQYSEINITGMRFIDPNSEPIQMLAFKLFRDKIQNDINIMYIEAWRLRLETALLIDALMMFGEALKSLPRNFAPPAIECSSNDLWPFGTTLTNIMKGIRYPGLTGYIKFDNMGFRSEFGLEVFEVKEGGITRVGNWTTNEGLNITRYSPKAEIAEAGSLVNKSFTVITCLTEPYGMRKESSTPLYGNDRYEGFAIDLIHEIAQILGFNYTFIIREDKKNGEVDPITGKWTGMIGDVIDEVADLAITDLTITSERQKAVDFTNPPFMNLGISILYQKPKKAPPSFFSFADPFALDVWKLLAAAFFIVSISLFIVGRISPDEWQNPYPCIEEPDFLVNQLSLRNCFWFMTGSIMQQGSEIAPVAISTRMVGGLWWFFTLIMVSSYTANLAAFLSTESADVAFTDVFELVKVAEQKGIKYGAKANGSTANFFRDLKQVEAYQKIFDYMKNHEDEVMVKDNKIGVDKAETENYAFFMEITSIEYETQRRCSLTSVGGLLDEKGYGIAMRKNSSYRNLFNSAVLKLQEDGVLADLKRRWWEERRGGGQCGSESENTEAKPLNLKNVGGVFWVTIIGSILSIVVVFGEMSFHVFRKSVKTKTPFKKLFMTEIKFIFKFFKRVKPVGGSKESSRKSESESRQESEHPKSIRQYGFVINNENDVLEK